MIRNSMNQVQKALRSVSLPLLPNVRLFSPEEADAVYKEWTYKETAYHGDYRMEDDEMPDVHPKIIPLYVMQRVKGSNDGVVDAHEPAYQSAHEKIKLYLSMLWNQTTLDETVVAQLDFGDKVMVHLLYGVPEERLGLVMKPVPSKQVHKTFIQL